MRHTARASFHRAKRDGTTVSGAVYRKLKALAPQSDETIEARELTKAAVIKRKRG